MKVIICDICKMREADKRYKVKYSSRGMYVRGEGFIKWVDDIWQSYQKIAICGECGKKLLGLTPYSRQSVELTEQA